MLKLKTLIYEVIPMCIPKEITENIISKKNSLYSLTEGDFLYHLQPLGY